MGLFDQDDKQAQLDLQKAEKSLKWEKPRVVVICFIIAFLIGIFKFNNWGNGNIIFVLDGVMHAFMFAVLSFILPGIIALIAKLLKSNWHYAFAISFAILTLLTLILGNAHLNKSLI